MKKYLCFFTVGIMLLPTMFMSPTHRYHDPYSCHVPASDLIDAMDALTPIKATTMQKCEDATNLFTEQSQELINADNKYWDELTGFYYEVQEDSLIEGMMSSASEHLNSASSYKAQTQVHLNNASTAWNIAFNWTEDIGPCTLCGGNVCCNDGLTKCDVAEPEFINAQLDAKDAPNNETCFDQSYLARSFLMEADARMDSGFSANNEILQAINDLDDAIVHFASTSNNYDNYIDDYNDAANRYDTLAIKLGNDAQCEEALDDIDDALDDASSLISVAFVAGNNATIDLEDAQSAFVDLYIGPPDNYQDAKTNATSSITYSASCESYLNWADLMSTVVDPALSTLDDRCTYAETYGTWPN